MPKATNFRFDQKTTKLLDKLKNESGASSRAEVVRRALNIMDTLYDAKEEHKKIFIRGDNNGERELALW